MNRNIDEIKASVKEQSAHLAKIGRELSEIRFNYKVLDKTETKYWQKRIEDFKRYHQKGIEYYIQAHSLMNLVEKEKAGMFLLSVSKLRQLGTRLLELLEEVKQNPSIMSSKDKQQSKWSKELKEQLIECSNRNLNQETGMNSNFREFYDKHLKNLLE